MQKVAESTVPFEIHVRGVGAFEDLQSARVVWAGVSNTKELRLLHETIGSSMGMTDQMPYAPHLTLGRLRNPQSVGSLVDPFLRKDFLSFHVDRLVLFESVRQEFNVKYTTISEYPFGASI